MGARKARKAAKREAMRLLRDHLGLARSSDERVLAKAVAVLRVYQAGDVEDNRTPVGFRQ